MRATLRLLGGIDVWSGDQALLRLALQPKRLALLVYLLLATPRTAHQRDKLLALFWPELDDAHARNALSKALQAVRGHLGEEVVCTTGYTEVSLRPDYFELDVFRFEESLAAGRLDSALALYAGDLLDGFFLAGAPAFEEWLEHERQRLRQAAVRAARVYSGRLLDAGKASEAVHWIRWGAQRSPVDETQVREDLLALWRAGDRAGALDLYQRFAERLRTEFEAEPSPRTVSLMEQVRSGATPDAAGRPTVSAFDLPNIITAPPVYQPAIPDQAMPVATEPVRAAGRDRVRATWPVIGLSLFGLVAAASWLSSGVNEEGILLPGAIHPVTADSGLEFQPAVSHDGSRIAYVAGSPEASKIYVRPRSGGPAYALTADFPGNHQGPAWSPDDSTILFDREGSIYAVPSGGGAPVVLVQRTPERAHYDAAFSPDGRRIVYVVNRSSLEIRSVEGGAAEAVVQGVELHGPEWSPDGRLIAYASGNYQFWRGWFTMGNLAPAAVMVVPIGGTPIAITERDVLRSKPVWTADGRHLLFMSAQDGGRDLYQVAIDRSGNPHGPIHRLTTGLEVGTFSLAVDGSFLVYSAFRNTAHLWSIRLPMTGGVTEAPTPVTTGTEHVEFVGISSDGRWLAFDSDRGGHPNLYRMHRNGREPSQLTNDPAFDFAPAWSPDDMEIAFHSWRNGSRDILIVSSDGGASRPVVTWPSQEFYPDWSPDGRTLVFESTRSGQRHLYLVDRDSTGQWGEPRELTKNYSTAARWSPTGPLVAHIGGRHGLRVVDTRDGTVRELLNASNWPVPNTWPGRVNWSEDGRTLYFNTWDAERRYHLWSIPVEGGMPRLVVRLEQRTVYQEFELRGNQLYFTMDDRESDIRLLELARR